LRALIVPAEFTQSGDPARDLRRLGEELIAIASQPPADFQHSIRPRVVRSAALYLAGIEQNVRTVPAPEFYVRRQKEHWEQLSQALTTDEYYVPRDLGEGPAAEIQQRAQSIVLRFGQVLHGWPAIVEAARRLRGRGHTLAQPV
jgi:hypothetical protein